MSEIDKVGDTEIDLFQTKTVVNLMQFMHDKPEYTTKRDIFKYSVNYVENVFEHDRMFHNTAKNPIEMSQIMLAHLKEEGLIVEDDLENFTLSEDGHNSIEAIKAYLDSMKDYHSQYDECELFGDPVY